MVTPDSYLKLVQELRSLKPGERASTRSARSSKQKMVIIRILKDINHETTPLHVLGLDG